MADLPLLAALSGVDAKAAETSVRAVHSSAVRASSREARAMSCITTTGSIPKCERERPGQVVVVFRLETFAHGREYIGDPIASMPGTANTRMRVKREPQEGTKCRFVLIGPDPHPAYELANSFRDGTVASSFGKERATRGKQCHLGQ